MSVNAKACAEPPVILGAPRKSPPSGSPRPISVRRDRRAGSGRKTHWIEGYWHKRFQPKHRGSEWFELTTDDVRTFKRRKLI
jgi:hypothetical protein